MKFAYLIEPPFNYLDDSGGATGCDVELARHVFHELGLESVEFVETEFAQLLQGLARGDWQMTTGLFASDARRKHVLFSRPIWALADGLLVRKAYADRIKGYRSLAADDDLTVAVIRDQIQHQTLLQAEVAESRIQVFETYAAAAQAVKNGQISAYASVARAHAGYLHCNGNQNLALVEVPADEKPPSFGCFGFARADPGFRNRVDHVLRQFLGSARHRALMGKFGFDKNEVDLIL